MMNRLIAFGCSYTYGHGLSDCFKATSDFLAHRRAGGRQSPGDKNLGAPGDLPSQYAWPKILADLLGRICCNNGVSGASNLEILEKILSYKFVSGDVVVVQWTFSERDMIFAPEESRIKLHANSDPHLLKPWTEVHSPYDREMRIWIQMHHAYHYLKNIGVEFYFSEKLGPPVDHFTPPSWLTDVEFLDINFHKIKNIYPLAQDNLHAGAECHQEYARLIWNQIS